MRPLILGGSFNPVHLGHLQLAEEVADEFGYDTILLVPAHAPPHKALVDDPGPAERLAMLRAAVASDSRYRVEPCEIERGGLSYTIDTLDHVLTTYPVEGRPALVLGDDLAQGFSTWRDPDGICARCDIIVARRGGGPFELGYPARIASNMLLPISSSEVRARIRSGRPWRRLVPEAVFARIMERRLYGLAPQSR